MLVRKYGKHMKPLHNYGLWWIVLLLYSPTVYVCMSVLSCFQLTTKDGNKKSVSKLYAANAFVLVYMFSVVFFYCPCMQVWFINGDVECFTGAWAHTSGPLGHAGVAVLFSSHSSLLHSHYAEGGESS